MPAPESPALGHWGGSGLLSAYPHSQCHNTSGIQHSNGLPVKGPASSCSAHLEVRTKLRAHWGDTPFEGSGRATHGLLYGHNFCPKLQHGKPLSIRARKIKIRG